MHPYENISAAGVDLVDAPIQIDLELMSWVVVALISEMADVGSDPDVWHLGFFCGKWDLGLLS